MAYFNYDLLVKVLPQVLASAIVLSALTVFTQNRMILEYQPRQFGNRNQAVVAIKLADYWGFSHRSLCKVTQALMQFTLGKHLVSQF